MALSARAAGRVNERWCPVASDDRNSALTSLEGGSSERAIHAILLAAPGGESSAFDLQALLRFSRRHWLVIFMGALLGAAGLYGVTFSMQKVYRAEVLLTPTNAGGELGGGGLQNLIGKYSALASVIGVGLPTQGGIVQVALARLQSRSFLEGFIADEKVMDALYPADRLKAQSAADGSVQRHTLQDGYNKFVRSIMLVKHDRQSDIVTIRIDWTDRVQAAAWANSLVHRLNAVMRKDAIDETDRSLKYLESALQEANYVTLKDSISSVMEAQINKRMLAVTQPDYAFSIIDPAQPSDANKKVAPLRSVYALAGSVLGGLAGVLWALRRERKGDAAMTGRSP